MHEWDNLCGNSPLAPSSKVSRLGDLEVLFATREGKLYVCIDLCPWTHINSILEQMIVYSTVMAESLQ